jgi:DNA uptake protein ComE-like DNA-binding protein
VLLIVLVLVVLLSLGVYTFTETAIVEAQATSMFGRDVQARTFADSGIELAAAILSGPPEETRGNLSHLPELFQGVLMRDADVARGRGRFSIVAPVQSDPSATTIRFGLIDESSKLNLNALVKMGLDAAKTREILMFLPEMTYETADAILDWVDEDGTSRQYGAESDYYETLPLPYTAKDGPLDSLDELLLVSGVTSEMLYGEDANRNGLVDANEDDGDGNPRLGWNAYLTVFSRETNRRDDGTKRIDLNQKDLADLYDQLEQELNKDTARFVAAYRMNGPKNNEDDGRTPSSGTSRRSSSNRAAPSGNRAGSSGNRASRSSSRSPSGQGAQVTRDGMDLSSEGGNKIKSIFDLVGVQVEATIDGASTDLDSPWSSDAIEMQEYLPGLIDVLSITSDEFIEGRVNINQTRLEVLLGLPGMTENVASAIVNSMDSGSNGEPTTDVLGIRSTTGWLFMEGLVDLEKMRELDKYLTTHGDVYRVQVLGAFDEGGPYSRLEAVIDATQQPAQVVFLQDLSKLGRGYSHEMLLGVGF